MTASAGVQRLVSRERLDLLLAALLGATVLAAAAGSSASLEVVSGGRPARWVLLALLGVVAAGHAAVFRRSWRLRPAVIVALAAFCALALDSAAWSIEPRKTLVRALSICAVIAVAAVVAGSAASSSRTRSMLLDALLVACGVVAAAGAVYWLVEPSKAVFPATTDYPTRFQGFEQNPNTAAMLLALGMPLALSRALSRASIPVRLVSLVSLLGFAAEIVASGSRGGLLAAFGSLLVVAALYPISYRRRALLVAGVVATLVVAAWVTTLPKALSSAAPRSPVAYLAVAASPSVPRPGYVDAETVIPLREEIGGTWWTRGHARSERSLFGTSTRLEALRGAIEQALGRPFAGYGFGAEQPAFANRYYAFNSDNPENGYVGLFLQFGLIGLGAFLAVAAVCLRPGLGRLIRGRGGSTTVAAVGVVSAGLLLGLSQSYFHAAGNIALVAFWVGLLVASLGEPGHEAA